MDVGTAGLRMSQVVLDKIAPVCHEPNLEPEMSDCDAVEIQRHNLRSDIQPACAGHGILGSGDVKTQGENEWVASVGR